MDWEQTVEDLATASFKNPPPSTAVQRSAISGRTIIPLLEYSAGGLPASTSQRRITADREIVNQIDQVTESRTRQSQNQASQLEMQYSVGYWKGKPQPKKPRRKQRESKEAFENRTSDYKQFIEYWKAANIRKPPGRRAKKN
jgi:hypothetical protein